MTSPLAKALHKEHGHLHALLVAATTDADRARYAREIMERIVPALDAEYDRLRSNPTADPSPEGRGGAFVPVLAGTDAGLGHSTLPRGEGSAVGLLRKLASLRSRISTLRKRLSTETDAARRAKLEAELEAKTAEKERLEQHV